MTGVILVGVTLASLASAGVALIGITLTRIALIRPALTRITLALLLTLAGSAAQADTWSDLWRTHEQQAQHLLDSKQPAQAAALFNDPRRPRLRRVAGGQIR